MSDRLFRSYSNSVFWTKIKDILGRANYTRDDVSNSIAAAFAYHNYCCVLEPVMSVTLLFGHDRSQGNFSMGFPLTSSHRGHVITPGKPRVSSPLTENQPSQVRCVAVGGYPPPRLELRVDQRRDVTAQMVLRHGVKMAPTSGAAGLRRLVRRTELSTFNYIASGDNDGRWSHCIATVTGRRPVVDSVQLSVHCTLLTSLTSC